MPAESMTERVEAAIGELRARGERVTPARRALLAVLAESSPGHLSADDIVEAIDERSPGVHRTTVYRTLDSLMALGLVAHVHLPHGAATYHLVDPGHRTHLHLACRGCDEVVDAPADLLDEVARRLRSAAGFELDPDHVALTGLCADCRDD